MFVPLVCFALYLMNRLMQVKSVELSTPRGFRIAVRDLEENASPIPSSTDSNVLDAFKTMNFHRSKMNEYLCDDFIETKGSPDPTPIPDRQTKRSNVRSKLIQDVGSNAYRRWLTRINGGSSYEGVSRRDYQTFGYAQGYPKKPFYKVRNNVEDKDIYFATSFPAYHVQQRYNRPMPVSRYAQNQTFHGYKNKINSKVPVTLNALYKNKHMARIEPNENIIGVNLHGKFVNLTDKYRKKLKTTVLPREPFQRRETSPNYIWVPSTDNVPVFVTQVPATAPSDSTTPMPSMPFMPTMLPMPTMMFSMGTMATPKMILVMSTSMDTPYYSSWSSYDNTNALNPPTEGNANNVGYYYTTMPTTDSMQAPYPTYYPPMTDSPTDITYPPYYPPYDAGNGYNVPAYGYTDVTSNNPPPYGYQPPSTPMPYGNDYTFNPPNNQNYGHHQEEQQWYMNNPPNENEHWYNSHPPKEKEHWYIGHPPKDKQHWYLSHPPKDEEDSEDHHPYNLDEQLMDENSQDLEDSRDGPLSNFLGPDAYELILTAIAFMAFGTYFMNMMMRMMEGNSGPTTMMIYANPPNNAIVPSEYENGRQFSDLDNLQIFKHILLSIDQFHELFAENRTNT